MVVGRRHPSYHRQIPAPAGSDSRQGLGRLRGNGQGGESAYGGQQGLPLAKFFGPVPAPAAGSQGRPLRSYVPSLRPSRTGFLPAGLISLPGGLLPSKEAPLDMEARAEVEHPQGVGGRDVPAP